jgi:crooked neck
MAAQFEIRQMRLGAARKLLGTAIGMCPKAKLFRCCQLHPAAQA